jgi:hypothetical protein
MLALVGLAYHAYESSQTGRPTGSPLPIDRSLRVGEFKDYVSSCANVNKKSLSQLVPGYDASGTITRDNLQAG